MSWSTIRRATDEDKAALEQAAQRFCERHGIECNDGFGPLMAIDCLTTDANNDDAPRLNRLWLRVVARALGKGAEGIAYGYVGHHAD